MTLTPLTSVVVQPTTTETVSPADAAAILTAAGDVQLGCVYTGDGCSAVLLVDCAPLTRGQFIPSVTRVIVLPQRVDVPEWDPETPNPPPHADDPFELLRLVEGLQTVERPNAFSISPPHGIAVLAIEALTTWASLTPGSNMRDAITVASSALSAVQENATHRGVVFLSRHTACLLGATAGALLAVEIGVRSLSFSVRISESSVLTANLARTLQASSVMLVDAQSFDSLRRHAPKDERHCGGRTHRTRDTVVYISASDIRVALPGEKDSCSSLKVATRVVLSSMSTLDSLALPNPRDGMVVKLLRQRPRRLAEGDVVALSCAALRAKNDPDPSVVDAVIAAEIDASRHMLCAHAVTPLYLRVMALTGGDVVDPQVTEVALVDSSTKRPLVGRVPPCSMGTTLSPVSVALQRHPAFARITETLATHTGSDATWSSDEWCKCIIISGPPAAAISEMVHRAASFLGMMCFELDAQLLDAPTAHSLLARTAFDGTLCVMRHMDRIEATAELAKFCVGAASQASWARSAMDSQLTSEQINMLAQSRRRLSLVLLFAGTEPPAPVFAAVATESPLQIGVPGDAERQIMVDALLSVCTVGQDNAPDSATAALPIPSITLSSEALAGWATGLSATELATWIETAARSHAAIHASCGGAPVITSIDFERALKEFQLQHGHNLTSTKLQPVKWDDVGGLEGPKREIMETIALPMRHPGLRNSGVKQRTGVLMYGPPGCGKTLLAKAVATELGLNFLSVKGPELINMYVGESEKNIRLLFQRARDNSPCICFFDELDALAPRRGAKGDSGGVMDRIVAQLLAEVDGIGGQKSDGSPAAPVFIIGATNRPDLLDPSLLRPGRFDRLCYLGPPVTKDDQYAAVKALTRKFNLAPDVDLKALVDPLEPIYSGADYFALCSDAMMLAVHETIEGLERNPHPADRSAAANVVVAMRHLLAARASLRPSVSPHDLRRYEDMKKNLRPQ